MDISGSCLIPAPRAAVWAALGDPDILKTCIPGCETIERTAEGGFEGAAAAKIGPIRATLSGRATPDESDKERRLTFSLEADDAKSGAGRGTGEVTLSDEGGGTLVAYQGSFEATGKIAQLGPRLVGGFARQTVDQALARLSELAAEGRLPDAAPAADGPRPGAIEPSQPAGTPERREREPEGIAAPEPRLAEAPPLVHEEPADAPAPVADAPPTASGLTPPQELHPIAPTATPAVPDPVEIAAAEAADPKSSGAVTRILLVAAIVIVIGFVAYVGFLQPPK